MDKALNSKLIIVVDEPHIRAKRHKHVGYANVTTKELLEHLYSSYAKITRGDLMDDEVQMDQPHYPSQPIEVLFDHIEDIIDFST